MYVSRTRNIQNEVSQYFRVDIILEIIKIFTIGKLESQQIRKCINVKHINRIPETDSRAQILNNTDVNLRLNKETFLPFLSSFV